MKEGKCINQAQSLSLTGAVCRTYFSERRSLKCRATFLICALSFECFKINCCKRKLEM